MQELAEQEHCSSSSTAEMRRDIRICDTVVTRRAHSPRKMQSETSLRTPRRAQTRNSTLPSALQIGHARSAPKSRVSRVDDRIKKRMSMRYAEMVASPTGNDAAPPLPGFPTGIRGTGQGTLSLDANFSMLADDDAGDAQVGGSSTRDDRTVLEDERFDPDACESPDSNRKRSC